jgi:hypothetical protein
MHLQQQDHRQYGVQIQLASKTGRPSNVGAMIMAKRSAKRDSWNKKYLHVWWCWWWCWWREKRTRCVGERRLLNKHASWTVLPFCQWGCYIPPASRTVLARREGAMCMNTSRCKSGPAAALDTTNHIHVQGKCYRIQTAIATSIRLSLPPLVKAVPTSEYDGFH